VAGFYVIESTEPTNRHLACIDYYHARLYCANPLENNKKADGVFAQQGHNEKET